jgi:hypothetical protein
MASRRALLIVLVSKPMDKRIRRKICNEFVYPVFTKSSAASSTVGMRIAYAVAY